MTGTVNCVGDLKSCIFFCEHILPFNMEQLNIVGFGYSQDPGMQSSQKMRNDCLGYSSNMWKVDKHQVIKDA